MNSDEVFTSLSFTQRRFLSKAIQENLSFIIIGGYAVRFHGYLRDAKDLDLLLQKTRENANIIYKVLSELGACNIDQVINFAVNEWKRITWYDVDILTNLWGTSYEKLYDNCIKPKIDRIHVSGLVLTSATLLRDLTQHPNKCYEFTWLCFPELVL